MKVVAILQARMGSTRLPGKMLLPLAGKPLVQNVIERVQRATTVQYVVLAVPFKDHDTFFPFVRDNIHLSYYSTLDDENDLVGRYLGAATTYGADLIVRIPCDNPCVDPAIIDEAVEQYLRAPHIYLSTMYRHVRDHVYVDGVGAEVFSMSRLKWLDQATAGQANYREHPHLLFQDWHLIAGWEQYQRHANVRETIRLDVNDMRDYEFVTSIYDHFGHNSFTTADVLNFLASRQVTA